ncbi:uncharacterized protein EV420DRAFT_1651457 [Desarmillaria tabescens]|uniref:Fibronectin type-III domain-containing protein n=1 Tax=Armillaria tabescens TaxID=1929756 RepID=A0AA39JAD3_ARMTA|nr:uncharacterized protein EV420DRAFT_1651457 [Desarmillaria tabescens]KAK0438312.1 hypothetical protein EV420DRAFT_1651457 [Desarmillaria tabescens]
MLTVLQVLTVILVHFAAAEVVPFLEPGFFFDYNKADEPVPILLTQQCEVIHLKWDRSQAIGQNPVAPYSLLVYTSTSETASVIDAGSGLSFDWAVPFPPGAQYQICMFDVNGVSGGCQDMYTMIPNSNGTNVSCPNVTSAVLSANGTVSQPSGPMSRFGFINQCTDVSVTPNEGTPPFTLTIAPALHPPFNLTSNTMDPITWTVSLPRAMPFYMSMVSSEGKLWANGPLHVGAFGPTDCLAPGTVSTNHAKSVAARAGVGGLFDGVALAAGILIPLSIWRRRRQRMQLIEITKDFSPFNDHRSSIVAIGQPQGLGMSREERKLDGVLILPTLSELSPAYASSGIHPSRVFDGTSSAWNQEVDSERGLPPSYSYHGRQGSRERPRIMPGGKTGR